MTSTGQDGKRGFLDCDFRMFRLCDSAGGGGLMHYHDFDKLVFFISGSVDYTVDGTVYPLHGGDVLLVRRYCPHRAEIDVSVPYERVIIYLDRAFAEKYGTEKTNLLRCFDRTEKGSCRLRPSASETAELKRFLARIENAQRSDLFGADINARTAMIDILVYINQLKPSCEDALPKRDGRIGEVMRYISDNLTEELSVSQLAARFYFSRYYFMRLFREMTGTTVHGYVREKRLLNAAKLIAQGYPAGRASVLSGFCDYSSFERAFRKEFGAAPSHFRKAGISERPEQE